MTARSAFIVHIRQCLMSDQLTHPLKTRLRAHFGGIVSRSLTVTIASREVRLHTLHAERRKAPVMPMLRSIVSGQAVVCITDEKGMQHR